MKGAGPSGRQYYCSSLLYASYHKRKILKETETEEKYAFCHVFIIGGNLIGKGGGPPGYAYSLHCVILPLEITFYAYFELGPIVHL